jgi:hypothetical protein
MNHFPPPWEFYEKAKPITMTFLDPIFGPSIPVEGKLLAERFYGYNLSSGAWTLCGSATEQKEPALFYAFLPKGKRKPRIINARAVTIDERR